MNIFPITWETARVSGSLVWEALDRVSTFSEEMGTEDTSKALVMEITNGIMSQNPVTVLWVIVDGDELVGHCVSSLRERGNHRWVEVTQLQKLRSVPEEIEKMAFEEMERWGASYGATQVRLATLCDGSRGRINSARARLFEAAHGFKPYRLVMVKEIDDEL